MNIYTILSSKPHNSHYLNRYITFIKTCQEKNIDYEGYTERHHICPKAKDLFSQYESFREYPWNLAVLTARQHLKATKDFLLENYPEIIKENPGLSMVLIT